MKTLEEIRSMERADLEALALSLDTGRALAEERATGGLLMLYLV